MGYACFRNVTAQCFLDTVAPMKTIRHRLRDIDPILYPLNDDGAAGTTIVIHGADSSLNLLERPDVNELEYLISEAQISGKVYLLSWRSGYSKACLPLGCEYHEVENNAHRLGQNLRTLLSKLPSSRKEKLRLIGHSLGAHVIISALLANDWKDYRVEDVILLGTALCENDFEKHTPRQLWRRCLGQIRGRIFNCYNRYDLALYGRKKIRWPQSESIGRGKASHVANRIQNISFTGRLRDTKQHSYLDELDWVLSKVYPSRARSEDYPVRAVCDCPWCPEEDIPVNANTDSNCPECRITFEYRTQDGVCYYGCEPVERKCPNCEGDSGIPVQESDRYECPDCKRGILFERMGSKIDFPKVNCKCPHCNKGLNVRPYEDVACLYCSCTFSFNEAKNVIEWETRPLVRKCPKCQEKTGIPVQEDKSYKCKDCGKRTVFEIVGRTVYY